MLSPPKNQTRSGSNDRLRRYGHLKFFQDGGGRHLGFVRTGNSAVRSAVSNELPNKNLLKFSPHLKSVATLPCETWNVKCTTVRHLILSRLTHAKQLLGRFSKAEQDFIWFTDEKVFTVSAPKNTQNDRVYAPVNTAKRHIAPERPLRERPTFSTSVIVYVAVSKLECTELFVVQLGVKVNGDYYREVLLKEKLLLCIKEISGEISYSNKTVHLRTGRVTQSHFYAERRQTSFLPTSGPQTAWTLWIIKYKK